MNHGHGLKKGHKNSHANGQGPPKEEEKHPGHGDAQNPNGMFFPKQEQDMRNNPEFTQMTSAQSQNHKQGKGPWKKEGKNSNSPHPQNQPVDMLNQRQQIWVNPVGKQIPVPLRQLNKFQKDFKMVPGQAKKLLMMQNRNQMVVHSKIGGKQYRIPPGLFKKQIIMLALKDKKINKNPNLQKAIKRDYSSGKLYLVNPTQNIKPENLKPLKKNKEQTKKQIRRQMAWRLKKQVCETPTERINRWIYSDSSEQGSFDYELPAMPIRSFSEDNRLMTDSVDDSHWKELKVGAKVNNLLSSVYSKVSSVQRQNEKLLSSVRDQLQQAIQSLQDKNEEDSSTLDINEIESYSSSFLLYAEYIVSIATRYSWESENMNQYQFHQQQLPAVPIIQIQIHDIEDKQMKLGKHLYIDNSEMSLR